MTRVRARAPARALQSPAAGERVLHFVRHGEYASGPDSEAPLTARGRRQARHLAAHFAGLPVACIRSSDLLRAKQTADILAKELGTDAVTRHRVLREMLPATRSSSVTAT